LFLEDDRLFHPKNAYYLFGCPDLYTCLIIHGRVMDGQHDRYAALLGKQTLVVGHFLPPPQRTK
jgi:hypothetical protein